LTIEEKTVFGNWLKKGKLKSEKDEVAAGQMELLMDLLNNAGYEQYEISNFSKPAYYSRHNTSYWKQKKYLGVGPSAHSYNGNTRQFNVSNNALYIQSLEKDKVPFESETLSRANKSMSICSLHFAQRGAVTLVILFKNSNLIFEREEKGTRSILFPRVFRNKRKSLDPDTKGKIAR